MGLNEQDLAPGWYSLSAIALNQLFVAFEFLPRNRPHAVNLSGSVVLMFLMSDWMLMLFIPVLVLMSVSRAVSTFWG